MFLALLYVLLYAEFLSYAQAKKLFFSRKSPWLTRAGLRETKKKVSLKQTQHKIQEHFRENSHNSMIFIHKEITFQY